MARLHEYQGKAILAANGFNIPRGRAASTPDEAVAVAKELMDQKGSEVVVKIQAWTTGRAALGGVAFAKKPDVARGHAARMLEMKVKPELKKDFIKTVREEVLPILRKQTGFMDVLAFNAENNLEKHMMISLWNKKADADKYELEKFLKVNEILRPLLLTPIVVTPFEVETAISDKVLTVAA